MSEGEKIQSGVLKRLFGMSGNLCSFPNCGKEIYQNESTIVHKVIAHIESDRENGPRYNINLNEIKNNRGNNLLILCFDHHEEVDRYPKKYTVDVLKRMKQDHLLFVKNKNKELERLKRKEISDKKITIKNVVEMLEISHSGILPLLLEHDEIQKSIANEEIEKIQKNIKVVERNLFDGDELDKIAIELMKEDLQIQNIFFLFGNFWSMEKNYEKSLKYYYILEEEIANVDEYKFVSDEYKLYYNIGYTLYYLDQFNKAIGYLEKSRQLNPKIRLTYESLGLLYSKLNRDDEAKKMLQLSYENSPNDFKTLSNYGNFLTKIKDYKTAEKLLIKAYNLEKRQYKVVLNLGVLYSNWEKLGKASRFYVEAIELDGTKKDAWFNYGILMWEMYESNQNEIIYFDNALKSLEKAYLIDSKDIDIKFHYALILAKIKNKEKLELSLKLLEEVYKVDGSKEEARARQIIVLAELDRKEEAKNIAKELNLPTNEIDIFETM